jgi:hypothetical protein
LIVRGASTFARPSTRVLSPTMPNLGSLSLPAFARVGIVLTLVTCPARSTRTSSVVQSTIG